MNKSSSHKCFYKNGKKVLKKKDINFLIKSSAETINSLIDTGEKFSISTVSSTKKSILSSFKFLNKKAYPNKNKSKIHLKDVRSGLTNLWASISVIVIFAFLSSLMLMPHKAKPLDTRRYAIYSSKPLTLQTSSTYIYSKDSRAQRINEVFKMYNCPLEGLGDVFVYEADKNNIPWWLVASVSFQESGCGKKTPKVGGVESYNAWGWGVYGGMAFSFDNWVRGIETVSKYFNEKFYSKGIEDTCEIMKIYTPPSNGSWCEGVNHFGELIQNYETPNN